MREIKQENKLSGASHPLFCRETPSTRRVSSLQTSCVLRRSRDQPPMVETFPGRSGGHPVYSPAPSQSIAPNLPSGSLFCPGQGPARGLGTRGLACCAQGCIWLCYEERIWLEERGKEREVNELRPPAQKQVLDNHHPQFYLRPQAIH